MRKLRSKITEKISQFYLNGSIGIRNRFKDSLRLQHNAELTLRYTLCAGNRPIDMAEIRLANSVRSSKVGK